MRSLTATLVVGCSLVGSFGYAAKITSADLKNEGPLRLAGDTVVVSVLLEPGEKDVLLRLRAYSANGVESQNFSPVLATGNNKDERGRLLVLRNLSRDKSNAALATVSAEVHVDGKELILPDGTNQIQYEVAAVVLGAADRTDVVPTPIWPVYVENGVRVFPSKEFLLVQPPRHMPDGDEKAPVPRRAEIHVALPSESNTKRWIYFATNRPVSSLGLQKVVPFKSTNSQLPAKTLSFGVAETKVPYDIHKTGALELGGWTGKRVQEAFTMKKPVLDYPAENFYKSVLKDDVLIYVHGFNNSFEDAIVQASQLRVDIGFRNFNGKTVAFSWPAYGGNRLEYDGDGVRAARSVSGMVEFLSTLLKQNAVAESKDRRAIHLIAHSMGNRVLLGALQTLVTDKNYAIPERSFGKIFLAAPDVPANDFAALVDSAAFASDRVTVYYSKKDVPLVLSELIHWDRRAGRNPRLAAASRFGKVDFICTDNVNTWKNRFGHGYFAGVDRVLTDISLLLEYNLPPQERQNLTALAGEGDSCWSFAVPSGK